MKEIWKQVVGFKHYQVSNLGSVRSIDRVIKYTANSKSRSMTKPGILLSKHLNHGYNRVILSKQGNEYIKTVGLLVAEAFLPNPNNLPQIARKDGNVKNDKLSNIKWSSVLDNVRVAIQRGLRSDVGSRNNNSKLNKKSVLEIRKLLKKNLPHKVIGDKFNISASTVSFIKHRKTWDI